MSKYKTSSTNIIYSDYPDLDVIRVDNTYYMVSTTMHFTSGCVILRSYNLIDWEFCSYVFENLEETPGQTLKDNKGIYGKGMWAASLRYHNGTYYVSFVANDTKKSYLFTSDKIEGPWHKSIIQGFYHDMSVLFDDDGKTYIVSGNTDIRLTEMESDLSKPKANGIDKIIIQGDKETSALGYEGSHIYKINGKYYIFFIYIPKGKMRTQACFVADNIEGPYYGGDVLCSDLGNWQSGVAQGGIVQSNDGKWYSIMFQDHGALGRIPVLVPIELTDNKFTFGVKGQVPDTVTVLDNNPNYNYLPLYSNDFTDEKGNLKYGWQWNHIPDKSLVKVSKNTLSITTDKTVVNVVQASNTLTQRTIEEKCFATVNLDASKLNNGDFAGFCALEGEYGFIGITKKENNFYLTAAEHKSKHSQWAMNVLDTESPHILKEITVTKPVISLKLVFDLTKDNQWVKLMYLDDTSKDFVSLTESPVKLRYTLDQFVGVRFALFCYSTKTTGGTTTFTDFRYGTW